MNNHIVKCPADHIALDFSFDRKLLDPVLSYLYNNSPLPEDNLQFPVGTITPDGRLDLCKQQLGVSGIQLVTEALHQNTVIRHLLAGTNAFGDPGAAAIAGMVAVNRTLETLYMGCNYVTEVGCSAICESLEQNQSVKTVWFKRNPIGQSAAAIIKMLQQNPSVRTLDLVNTCMEADFTTLLRFLEQNTTVERLYLSGNYLGADQMQPVSRMLAANRTLKAVFLSVNNIGDAGAGVLAAGLSQNTALEEISLASCGIGTEGIARVLQALAGNNNLRIIDLGYAPSTRVLRSAANTIPNVAAIVNFIDRTTGLQYMNLVKTGLSAADKQQILAAAAGKPGLHVLLERLETPKYFNAHPDSRAIKSVYR